jgi:hypothetical protein
MRRFVMISGVLAIFGLAAFISADSRAINFETSQGYHTGTIQDQPGITPPPSGWGGSFPPGVINPAIDQEVVAYWPGRPPSFGFQSWRLSNAYTSGSFGDMPFSPSLTNEAGETMAQNSIYSDGVRQNHFEVQWSFTSADPTGPETDSYFSTSPDRGDGARMSYIRLEDHPSGIEVWFDDYQDHAPRGHYGNPLTAAPGCGPEDEFTDIKVATVSRNRAHTVKLAMDFVDGPHNDIVKVYVDGSLRHIGTSWEDYFRWCTESGGGTGTTVADQSRTVDSMIFRVGGGQGETHPLNRFKGFLIDNLSYLSSQGKCRNGDGDGDFEDEHGGKHHGKFHHDSCENDRGRVEDDDRDSGKHFESTSTDSATFTSTENSQTLTMIGSGLDDGIPVGFTMIAVDYGGAAPAVYTLILTNGRTFTGRLVSGSLLIQ